VAKRRTSKSYCKNLAHYTTNLVHMHWTGRANYNTRLLNRLRLEQFHWLEKPSKQLYLISIHWLQVLQTILSQAFNKHEQPPHFQIHKPNSLWHKSLSRLVAIINLPTGISVAEDIPALFCALTLTMRLHSSTLWAVPYTLLTLPTNREAYVSMLAGSWRR